VHISPLQSATKIRLQSCACASDGFGSVTLFTEAVAVLVARSARCHSNLIVSSDLIANLQTKASGVHAKTSSLTAKLPHKTTVMAETIQRPVKNKAFRLFFAKYFSVTAYILLAEGDSNEGNPLKFVSSRTLILSTETHPNF
jgi:hypothetical protein